MRKTPHPSSTEVGLRKSSFRPGVGRVKLKAKLWRRSATVARHELVRPTQRALDPRLRRLLSSELHDDYIAAEMRAGYLQCVEPAKKRQAPHKDNTYARVLVKLSRIPQWKELQKARHIWRKPVHIAGGYYSVDIRLSQLDRVAAHRDVQYVEAARSVSPALKSPVSRVSTRSRARGIQTHLDGTGVVIGIVDYGINYLSKDFQDKDGKTRIAHLWDQQLRPRRKLGERSPRRYGHGVEYEAAAIDKAIDAAKNGRDPFRKVRHRPKHNSDGTDVGGHGTAVAGIAAGNGRTPAGKNVGVAPGATIVFVHLSRKQMLAEVKARDTTLADSAQLAEAIAYCFEKAGGQPCVVNLSMGFNGGGHDGHSPIEEIIDAFLKNDSTENKRGRAVVVAAGNEADAGTHCSGILKQGHTRTLRWRMGKVDGSKKAGGTFFDGLKRGQTEIPEEVSREIREVSEETDRTLNEMEIWYSSKDRCRVRLVDPDNKSTPAITVDKEWSTDFVGARPPFPEAVFIHSESSTTLNPDAARIYIRVAPRRPGAGIRPGTWRVELEGDLVKSDDARFDAWIEREDVPRWESSFVKPIKTATMTTPATARRAIAVANYDRNTGRVAENSGRGPTRDRHRRDLKPEVAAPGIDTWSSNAFFARKGGEKARFVYEENGGTSLAAPYVAGVIALLLQRARQQGVDLTAEDIRTVLIRSARTPRGVRKGSHDPAWGYGKVDARAALKELERNFL